MALLGIDDLCRSALALISELPFLMSTGRIRQLLDAELNREPMADHSSQRVITRHEPDVGVAAHFPSETGKLAVCCGYCWLS